MLSIYHNDVFSHELNTLRLNGGRIGFVPTMGALHAGHLSLVDIAREHADHVIVSVFVNPTQFGPTEDLARYPRQEAQDAAMLEKAGADIVWFPKVEDIYPTGARSTLKAPETLSTTLCGAARPGHFDGVATVVMRLFDLVRPGVAVFGEKDFQQLAILRAVAATHHPEITILGAPIIRERDGLAMSSRNAYLSPGERALAPHIQRTLQKVAAAIQAGTAVHIALADGINALEINNFKVDYLEFCDAATLAPAFSRPGRLLVAARLGTTRLIDNIAVPSA